MWHRHPVWVSHFTAVFFGSLEAKLFRQSVHVDDAVHKKHAFCLDLSRSTAKHSNGRLLSWCRVRKGTGSQLVVVCAGNILEARADSRFYNVLLELFVMGAFMGFRALFIYTGH